MNIRPILTYFLALAVAQVAFGQKVKYKELFVLLSAKQYTDAEPFLKKYLKVNDDNPNAYLFMGLIYEDKASKIDLLKQTETYVSQVDSAVYFYGLASKGMTEKEVSRNDEWYQMYNRRDQRTGEFGVKLSDVVLDLETRMKLKERAKQAVILKSQFVAAERSYLHAVNVFTTIQGAYADQKQLYLQSNDSLLVRLRFLASVADSCHIHFNDYKATAKRMGKLSRNQDFNSQDIVDFKKATEPVDFYLDDIKVLDFKRWALSTVETIEKEIIPLRDQLIARDIEINRLQHQVKKDSVTVRTELTVLRTKGFPELLKIDPNPLPIQVFAMKEAELEFGSQTVENRALRDSARISLQLEGLRRELGYAKKLDSVAGLLMERNVEVEATNYRHFVSTAFGSVSYLKTLIRSTKEFAMREIIHRESALKRKSESMRWIVNGTDSIPLFSEVLATGRFKPLIIQEDKYTSGLVFADTVGVGYFYRILPSRSPETKVSFLVNGQVFKKRYIPLTKAISTQDQQGMVYFILTYLETKIKDKYPATLTKIYKVEGLAWSVNVLFDQLPIELLFAIETSELTVKSKSSIGEMFVTTFDRNGKPR